MIIIRTMKKSLMVSLAIIIYAAVLAVPFSIDKKWGTVGMCLFAIILSFYVLIRSYQVALFRERRFTLIFCLDRKRHYSYEDIEQVYITTVVREKKKPEKWIILHQKNQLFDQINYINLDSYIKKTYIISFRYSKRREEIMDRFFAGKKKYAILHDSTGVFEETDPS